MRKAPIIFQQIFLRRSKHCVSWWSLFCGIFFGLAFSSSCSIEVSPISPGSSLCSSVAQVGVDANSKSDLEKPLVRDFLGYSDFFRLIGLTHICNAPFFCFNFWSASACIHALFTFLVISGIIVV
ncbi:hypothetical protein AMTRI_Chr07g27550 [Amborella trichopoda]